jgi:hypothetical protein
VEKSHEKYIKDYRPFNNSAHKMSTHKIGVDKMSEKIIYEKCKKFFKLRFNRGFKPEVDPYAGEWLDRFKTGYPERYMDSKSVEVYVKMIKNVI